MHHFTVPMTVTISHEEIKKKIKKIFSLKLLYNKSIIQSLLKYYTFNKTIPLHFIRIHRIVNFYSSRSNWAVCFVNTMAFVTSHGLRAKFTRRRQRPILKRLCGARCGSRQRWGEPHRRTPRLRGGHLPAVDPGGWSAHRLSPPGSCCARLRLGISDAGAPFLYWEER